MTRVWEVSHVRHGAPIPEGAELSPLTDTHHGRHVQGMAVREVTPGPSRFVAARYDGARIEVIVFENDGSPPTVIPITRLKALDLAHHLIGMAISAERRDL